MCLPRVLWGGDFCLSQLGAGPVRFGRPSRGGGSICAHGPRACSPAPGMEGHVRRAHSAGRGSVPDPGYAAVGVGGVGGVQGQWQEGRMSLQTGAEAVLAAPPRGRFWRE